MTGADGDRAGAGPRQRRRRGHHPGCRQDRRDPITYKWTRRRSGVELSGAATDPSVPGARMDVDVPSASVAGRGSDLKTTLRPSVTVKGTACKPGSRGEKHGCGCTSSGSQAAAPCCWVCSRSRAGGGGLRRTRMTHCGPHRLRVGDSEVVGEQEHRRRWRGSSAGSATGRRRRDPRRGGAYDLWWRSRAQERPAVFSFRTLPGAAGDRRLTGTDLYADLPGSAIAAARSTRRSLVSCKAGAAAAACLARRKGRGHLPVGERAARARAFRSCETFDACLSGTWCR